MIQNQSYPNDQHIAMKSCLGRKATQRWSQSIFMEAWGYAYWPTDVPIPRCSQLSNYYHSGTSDTIKECSRLLENVLRHFSPSETIQRSVWPLCKNGTQICDALRNSEALGGRGREAQISVPQRGLLRRWNYSNQSSSFLSFSLIV